jgi:hypothetical protein
MNRLTLILIFASSATAQLLVLNKEGNVAVVEPATQKGPWERANGGRAA